MEKFVHRQNLQRYRDLLNKVTDEEQRRRIKELLAQEEAKDTPPDAVGQTWIAEASASHT